MKKGFIQALLCTGLLTSMAWAQEFPQTPKQETLADAIKFEKYKIAAAEAQARKDAAESGQARDQRLAQEGHRSSRVGDELVRRSRADSRAHSGARRRGPSCRVRARAVRPRRRRRARRRRLLAPRCPDRGRRRAESAGRRTRAARATLAAPCRCRRRAQAYSRGACPAAWSIPRRRASGRLRTTRPRPWAKSLYGNDL